MQAPWPMYSPSSRRCARVCQLLLASAIAMKRNKGQENPQAQRKIHDMKYLDLRKRLIFWRFWGGRWG